VDLAELSALSKQVMPGVDKEDEAVITEVDHVHLDVIAPSMNFSSKLAPLTDKLVCVHFQL
jgi:hypothetical protein